MAGQLIQLADRRRKPADVTADQHQETVMELAVRNAESLMYARRVLRLSVQELRRATTDPDPVAARRAA